MSDTTPRAVLAVPGALSTPTGGYGYARRLLAETDGTGANLILRHWPLPGGFPNPRPEQLAEAETRLACLPRSWPVIIDGLALGVLSPESLRAIGAPVIALCHHPLGLETGLAGPEAARRIASERAALAASAGVITTSHTTARILSERFGVPPGAITVAPPGTDPAPQAAGSDGPGVQILSVGSLTPRKGHDSLLRALSQLAELDWSLTIIGPAHDGACAEHLAELAARLGIASRVRFAGSAGAAELDAAYARADLFALASRYEGFGMAYAEAMARGLPVVGTATGAVPEATSGAAHLVPPDEPGALADALGALIRDGAARQALAARCRRAAAGFPRWSDTAAAVSGAVAAVMAHA